MSKRKKNYPILRKKELFSLIFGGIILIVLFSAFLYRSHMRADIANPNIDIMPLVRSAYFQFNLNQFPNLPTNFFDPNSLPDPSKPIVETPKVHRAFLYWKPHETTTACNLDNSNWKDGQEFQRVQGNLVDGGPDLYGVPAYTDPRMATMLLGLMENSTYDYKITFSDGGDGSLPVAPVCGVFTTRSSEAPHSDLSKLEIDKNTINITQALDTYLSDGNYPANNVTGKHIQFNGDIGGVKTIIRGLGEYSDHWNHSKPNGGDSVASYNASAENWLLIEGRAGDNVVLDGSDPQFDSLTPGKWTACTSGNNYCNKPGIGITDSLNIYRISSQYYDISSDGQSGLPIDPNGMRLKPSVMYYEKENGGNPERLINNNGNFGLLVSRASSLPYEGTFLTDGGYIYVHLNDGIDPNSVFMKVPIYKNPFAFLGSSYIAFRNLSFQYFRDGSIEPLGGTIGFSGSHDLLFDGLSFKGVGAGIGSAAFAYRYPLMMNSFPENKNIIIKNSNFASGFVPKYDGATHTWKGYDWNTIKFGNEAIAHVYFQGGYGISILDSNFLGGHDGITPACGGSAENNYEIPPNELMVNYPMYCTNKYDLGWEVDNNYFKGIQDDAVEMRVATVGIAVTRNKFDNVYKDISLAPVVGGPYYISRNISVQSGGSLQYGTPSVLKTGNQNFATDTAYKLVANNTFINTNANYPYINSSENPQVLTGFNSEGRNFNVNMFNNIMISDNAPIQFSNEYVSCYPQIFDNNLYTTVRNNRPYYAQGTSFFFTAHCPLQGDTSVSNSIRGGTFQEWQSGKPASRGDHFPGADSPTDPTYHSIVMPWLHDPNSKVLNYNEGQAPSDLNFMGFEMSNPGSVTSSLNGDFRPKAGTEALAMGRDLANITYDVGPGWASPSSGFIGSNFNQISYNWPALSEPSGNVTVGAIPGPTNEGSIVITMPVNPHLYPNRSITLNPTVDGATSYSWAKVSGPINSNVNFGSASSLSTSVNFDIPGTYTLSLTAVDNSSHTATRQLIVYVHKPGDINNQNGVNFDDFTLLLANWGTPNNPMADINGDGTVDFQNDFTLLLFSWG